MPSLSRKRMQGQTRKVNQAPVPFGTLMRVLRANLKHDCNHGLVDAAHPRVRTRFTEVFYRLWSARWATAVAGPKFSFSTNHTMQAISDACKECPNDLKHGPTRNFLKIALTVAATDCLLLVNGLKAEKKDGHCVPTIGGLPRRDSGFILSLVGHSLAGGVAYIEKCEMNGYEPIPINGDTLDGNPLFLLPDRIPCSCLDEMYNLNEATPETAICVPCGRMKAGIDE